MKILYEGRRGILIDHEADKTGDDCPLHFEEAKNCKTQKFRL